MNRLRRRRRNFRGASITELLVCVLVMGIAFAGLCEATWLNYAWANLVNHKLDNQFRAKNFLQLFQNDIQQAIAIDFPASESGQIGLLTPNGWISYKIFPSSKSGQFKILRQAGTPSMITGLGASCLDGVIGPFSANQPTQPAIFEKISDKSSPLPREIIVDLDMANTDVATNRGAFGGSEIVKSAYSVRREFFLRNSRMHGGL